MLALNLGRIRTAQERVEREYPSETPELASDDYRLVAPAVLAFDVHKDKQQFRLAGRVTTMLELACSRCLDPFTWPVEVEFDLRYLPQAAATHSGAGEREIDPDDMTTAYYLNDEIDLGQLMEERFYLSLPMKPLCRDDCRGLCPVCGTNHNRGTCDCNAQWEDPRLAALRALKRESYTDA